MKKITLIFLIFIYLPLCAQESSIPALPQKCIAAPSYIDYKTFDNSWKNKYSSYQEYVVTSIKNGDYHTLPPNPKAWVVFSDRANNTTFSSPNGSPCGELKFMEKVYIAKLQKGWALVFSDDHTIGNDLSINKSAKPKGWIPIEKLLLWTKCPQTDNKILQKGLIIQDLGAIGNNDVNGKINYLDSPKEKGTPNGDARQLDIPFIMKTEKINGTTYYLLASNSIVEERGTRQASIVLGWLPEKFLTPWNQRLCLEPAAENVSCLKGKTIYPAIFETKKDAEQFIQSPSQASSLSIKTFEEPIRTGMRPKGYVLRMPILQKTDADIYEAVGIGTNEEASTITDNEIASLLEELSILRRQLNNVNIIFVLDATNSMKPYFNAVSTALTSIINRDFAQDIKIGVVIYRNEADGKQEIEYKKLTPRSNISGITNFIDNTQCFSKGNGYYESFYKGLLTALDSHKMGYTNEQSNFIITIGDCGNKEDSSQLRKIGETLNKNNINFFAYHVALEENDAHWDYKGQVISILKRSIDTANAWPSLVERGLYRIVAKHKGIPTNQVSTVYFGGARLASNGNINISTFKSSIVETVTRFIKYTQDRIAEIEAILAGKTKVDGSWNWDNMAIILKRRGFTDEKIEAIRKYGAPSKYIGYAPMRLVQCPEDLFNYTLFFSHDELSNLVHTLKQINPAKSQSTIEDNQSTRKLYQDALIQLGLAFLGENEDRIRNMDSKELFGKIYGVPVKINNCGIDSIKNITNPDIVSSDDFKNFATSFSSQTRQLERIINHPYTQSFGTDVIYYWVPFKSIPGYCAE